MIPLSMPAKGWTVLARTEIEDRGDVRSGYEDAGSATVTAYPKIVTVARTEDGIVTDRRLDAYVVGRSDISPGDRMEGPDGSAWSVVSAWPTTTGCTLELAREIRWPRSNATSRTSSASSTGSRRTSARGRSRRP